MSNFSASRQEFGSTTIEHPTWTRWLVALGFPVIGAGLGVALVSIVGWILTLPWFPLQGMLGTFHELALPLRYSIGAALGLIMGIVFVLYALNDFLRVSVGNHEVSIASGFDDPITLPKADIEAVFYDQKHLVFLGEGGRELARPFCDLNREEVADAFLKYRFPWQDGDPYAEEYRRWVPGLEELPSGADALFTAREAALKESDDDEIAQLRTELLKVGLVVRDDGQKQFWRIIAPSKELPANVP
ncbi:YqeB family protein [Natronoglycomyces albus]|uniref:DUF308 domain-containing protein n=1 Tax=Natronoglycomyces albus TaxID=2811108 RepID=A0A895XLM5_9ACTN|nr:hypothetical protein [Natronoglycomyces albus]QSB06601.1 hypothetical protein JQS30_06805 [Natronoglycomyces albus]